MTQHPEEPDDLFARLRDADPAASLAPADPTRVARLLEDVMSPVVDRRTAVETAPTRTRQGRPRPARAGLWAAAAAVALIAAAGLTGIVGLGSDDDPTPPVAQPAPTVTELTVPAGAPARCMVPNPEVLSNAAFALDAEVVAVADGAVVLAPSQWYAGDPTDRVEIDAPPADLQALIGAPAFEVGQRYLVAGDAQGQIMVCGFSGPWTQERADLYSQAFDS